LRCGLFFCSPLAITEVSVQEGSAPAAAFPAVLKGLLE
jgi:hypothetical protein